MIEDRIVFPWFRGTDSAHIDAYATFICALCETALRKKRVTATQQPTGVNDRYRLRCFLLSLGMIGEKYTLARRLLIGPMEGSSGWLTPPAKTPAPAPVEEAPEANPVPADEAPQEAPAEEPAAE